MITPLLPQYLQMFRRASLSAWLSSQLRVVAEKKTLEYTKLQSCHLPAVLAWLCGGGIKEAAEVLIYFQFQLSQF